MNYKKRLVIGILCLSAICLCGCHSETQGQDDDHEDNRSTVIEYDDDDFYSDYDEKEVESIDLNKQSGNVVITQAGTYVLSGTLKGKIEINVNKEDVVRLILNNVDITSSDGAAIVCTQSKKLIISLPENSENVIRDSESYSGQSDETIDATIFVQDDLTINGTGKLSVYANYQDAIKTKDTLKLMSGTYCIDAKDDGVIGKDFVYIHDGTYEINAQGDGIKTTYDTDETKGDLIIENGNFQIKSGSDGIQAEHQLMVYDGNLMIVTGGGSGNVTMATKDDMGFGQGQSIDRDANSNDTSSEKGLKAGTDLTIYDGIFELDTSDDAIHANQNVTIEDGNFTISSGDDGVHADGTLTINGGSMDIAKSYEGLEGSDIIINDGYVLVCANDDGVNAAGNNETETTQGSMTSNNHQITIHGGSLQVDAMGDGLDANGNIVMDGGSVVVFGPDNGGDGALDYDGTFEISGGILITTGSSQMALAPSQSSTQYSLMASITMQSAQTPIYLCDSDGNLLYGVLPSRAYDNIVISAPQLSDQSTYQLYVGGSGGNVNDNGYMESGLSGGILIDTITLTSVVTTYGNSGMGPMAPNGEGGNGMPPEGMPSGMPEQMPQEPPQDGMEHGDGPREAPNW